MITEYIYAVARGRLIGLHHSPMLAATKEDVPSSRFKMRRFNSGEEEAALAWIEDNKDDEDLPPLTSVTEGRKVLVPEKVPAARPPPAKKPVSRRSKTVKSGGRPTLQPTSAPAPGTL